MPTAQKFAAALFVVIALIATLGVASLSTTYHPHGLDPLQRPAYYERIEQLERRSEIATELSGQLGRLESTIRHHDFGRLQPGSKQSHRFFITNCGSGPLTLSVGQTTCKCTVGELENNVLLPGEQTHLELQWNAGRRADHYTQTAVLRTDDPDHRSVEFTVSGTIVADIAFLPEAIAFGAMDVGKSSTASLMVYSQRYDDFAVTDVTGLPPGATWTVAPADPQEDARLYEAEARSAIELSVSFAPPIKAKVHGQVTVTVQTEGEPLELVVPYGGRVRSPVSFYSPDIRADDGLHLGTINRGEQKDYNLVVRLRTPSPTPLVVKKVEPDALRAKLSPIDEFQYRLTLTVPPNASPVVFNRESQHGYVEIGSEEDPSISNWFPVWGAIVDVSRSTR